MKIQDIRDQTNYIFSKTVKKLTNEDVKFCFVGYYPERYGIARDVVKAGGHALIAGGQQGVQTIPDVVQYGLAYDTTGLTLENKTTRAIINAIPASEIQNKKIAMMVYPPLGSDWSRSFHERNLNTNIVASNEQNLGLLFEEKGYLASILQKAGLVKHMVPSEIVLSTRSEKELRELYKKMKGENSKVVVQSCFEFSGGGKGTSILNCEEEFIDNMRQRTGINKVATYIEGPNGNLTAASFNLVPSETGYGAVKYNIDESKRTTLDIENILKTAAGLGVLAENSSGIVTRSTLKAVGDCNLTSINTNGVGNSLGYVYEEPIRQQIAYIGKNLTTLAAQCGGVGLMGADLIMDKYGVVKINEINYRQQGPSDKIGRDGEINGLPAIQKIGFISNFADLTDIETRDLLQNLSKYSNEISEAYSQSPGRFYLKICALHEQGYVPAISSLKQGVFNVSFDRDSNKWNWKNIGSSTENIHDYGTQCPDSGSVIIKVTGGEITAGTPVQPERQIFRLEGVAQNGSSPIVIQNHKSCVSEKWQPLINGLYDDIFGKGYREKNPLYNSIKMM